MPSVSPALYLPVAYDDITKQLANDNNNYKFSACSYSVLQELAVEIEVMVTSHPEVVRDLHVWCTCSSKVSKRFISISDELEISWIMVLVQFFSGDESLLHVPWSSFRRLLLIYHGKAHSTSLPSFRSDMWTSAPLSSPWPDWDDTCENIVQFDPVMLAICHHGIHWR